MANAPEFHQLEKLRFEDTNCPVCSADNYEEKYSKIIHGYTIRYVLCGKCCSIYAKPRLLQENLKNLYASELFFEGKEDNLNYYSYLRGEKYLRLTAGARLKDIMKYAPAGKLLEAACAAGFFLSEAKARGFEAQGVEISLPMAQYVQKQYGIKVFPESIEEIKLPRHEYDVIAAWGLFTIIRNPAELLRKFNKALKPGGCLAFNTYYSESLWGRFFGKNWYILVLNTSQIFSKAALNELIRACGFEIVYKKRERPYASLERLLFAFLSHFPKAVRNSLFERLKFLNNFILRLPLPDVYEYICIKKNEV